ncbi:hypothetical protein [Neisseria montereyensis]|uniref:Uncharacterized protein n=1 Tax=Neisseria montereyensis TaxID=2973938 RepID=A0ABT2F9W4_9NEIS|nr:hypothetical protein [Neisseria montereyensis]MCS4532942.1 hypothetical protein [Neisseria montereyensis]
MSSYTSFKQAILLLAASGATLSDLKSLQDYLGTQSDYEADEVADIEVLQASI